MAVDPDPGELEDAIASGIASLFSDDFGRGPARARALMTGDYVFVAADDVLSVLERSLVALGDDGLVRELRLAFEDVMAAAFVGVVESALGRTVVGYHSQIFLDRDAAFELFVLDPEQPGLRPPSEPAEAVGARETAPGRPGDADRLPGPGERPAAAASVERPRTTGGLPGAARDAITREVVRSFQQLVGRGASRARTYDFAGFVITACDDPLVPAEQALFDGGRADLVRRVRDRLASELAGRVSAVLAEHGGGEVVECRVQVVHDPDVMFVICDTRGAAPAG